VCVAGVKLRDVQNDRDVVVGLAASERTQVGKGS
jgi:hypothetical protein